MSSDPELQTRPRKPIGELSIPAFPPLAIRVLQLVSDDDVEIKQVLDLLRGDPAFSAEVLRRANSPAYGFKSQIDSLQHALAVLGLRRIKVLAMTVATRMYLKSALKIDELRRCWHHTLACAILTEELARACGIHEDRAYTAGLLHDVGRIGLLAAYPEEYLALLRKAAEQADLGEPMDLPGSEAALFGVDHCEAGRRLADKWKLPPEFGAVAAHHHEPPSGEKLDLLALVSLGCRLADAVGYAAIPSFRPGTLEEIRSLLPEAKRSRFQPDPGPWKDLVEGKLQMFDLPEFEFPGPRKGLEEIPASLEAAPEPSRSLSQDATLVIAGGLLLAAAFIALQQFVLK